MKEVTFVETAQKPYSAKAIIRNDFPGFEEDYLVIHSLIRKYKSKRLMEIGTSSGLGTKIICNAMGIKRFWFNTKKVFSIDVLPGTDSSIIYPNKEDGHPEVAGVLCKLPYTQIFGNSLNYDFSKHYPIDTWFIDGKHNYEYVKSDSETALKSEPKLIIWHDLQIEEVHDAVVDVMSNAKNYDLYRVIDTRIAYALKK